MSVIKTESCFLCHKKSVSHLYGGHDRMHGIVGEFGLVQCQNCGLVWVSPNLEEDQLKKYYPEEYICYANAVDDEKDLLRKIDRQFGLEKRVRRIVSRVKQSGRILDIGCATGVFLEAMKQHDWDCYGIEPSIYASEYARTRFGLNVATGFMKQGLYPSSYFDVVSMWDVFEHISNPRELLSNIAQVLKPNGLLVICTPNSDSWERKLFGKYWVGWEVPRHYYIYNQGNLSKLLVEAGFSVSEVSSFTGRYGVLIISIAFWLKDQHLPDWLKKSILTISGSLFFRIITYPYFMIADRINKSSIMTVFAKKNLP